MHELFAVEIIDWVFLEKTVNGFETFIGSCWGTNLKNQRFDCDIPNLLFRLELSCSWLLCPFRTEDSWITTIESGLNCSTCSKRDQLVYETSCNLTTAPFITFHCSNFLFLLSCLFCVSCSRSIKIMVSFNCCVHSTVD